MSAENVTKRQRILAAAGDLFCRAHDIKRVSLESIAREARVSPTTIYNHFGNRETLVFEVIKDLVGVTIERNRNIIRSEAPFPQKLMSITGGKLDMVEKVNGEIIQKMISQDEHIAPFIDRIMEEEIKPIWREMVEDGKKQGYIDPALNDAVLLAYLDVMQAGFRARPDLLRDFQDNMDFIEQLARLMFYGFLIKDIDLFRKEAKQSHG